VRVCFYHRDAAWTGRARAFADAARALRERGYEVSIVAQRDTEAARCFAAQGFETHTLRTDASWIRVGWRLRRVLAGRFVEVVFVHDEREQLEAAAAVRFADRGAIMRRVPPLGHLTLGRDARLGMRLASSGFLFAFEEDLRSARPPRRALEPVVAPPAVESGGAPARDATAPRSIVTIFDGARRTEIAVLLRAAALLADRHPDLRFTLVGPPDHDDAVRLQAAALGVAPIVTLVTDPAARTATVAAATLAWVCADADDAAYALLDAQRLGVPVIATRDPLTLRFVSPDVDGLLTAPLDAAALAATFASLLADPSRTARLAAGGIAAAARWTGDAMAEGFERAAAAARDRTRWRV
jgi:hypothetical protein